MTDKQKAFCDEYLIDLNATRAYKAAYPNIKSDRAAGVNASKLLKNTNIREYIDEALEKLHSERTADAREVLEYLTSVMRREKKENVVVTVSEEKSSYKPDNNGTMRKHTVKTESPMIVEIPTKVSDANKAAELLGKYHTLFTDKLNVDGDLDFKVTVDYGEEDNS